jgi:hypothetical protein
MTCGLRFATKEEAEAYISAMHWTLVCETRVTETDDPVNYRWVGGKLVPVDPNCTSCGVELKSDPPHDDDEFPGWCHQCHVKRRTPPPTQLPLDL